MIDPQTQLQTISLLCSREGIAPPQDNPTAFGQVYTLLCRLMRAEETADRYLSQYREARSVLYTQAETIRLLERDLNAVIDATGYGADTDTTTEPDTGTQADADTESRAGTSG